jgi:hypothetical protein
LIDVGLRTGLQGKVENMTRSFIYCKKILEADGILKSLRLILPQLYRLELDPITEQTFSICVLRVSRFFNAS